MARILIVLVVSSILLHPLGTVASGGVPTADGRIVFIGGSTSSSSDVYVMASDGSGRVRIIRDLPVDTPAWSPDGSRIAFMGWSGASWDIYVAAADGTDVRQLTRAAREEGGPSWSPNGSKIAYYRGKTIRVVSVDGMRDHLLTPVGTSARFPTWSPDGVSIAFQTSQGIAAVPANGGAVTILTTEVDRYPEYSPNGSKIAFSRDLDDIWTIDADGGNPTNVTNGVVFHAGTPTWSTDGARITFDTSFIGEIYSIAIDGTDLVNLTNTPVRDEGRPDQN